VGRDRLKTANFAPASINVFTPVHMLFICSNEAVLPHSVIQGVDLYSRYAANEKKRHNQKQQEANPYRRRTTMKTVIALISALAFVGAASVASAAPASDDFGSQKFWQEISSNS